MLDRKRAWQFWKFNLRRRERLGGLTKLHESFLPNPEDADTKELPPAVPDGVTKLRESWFRAREEAEKFIPRDFPPPMPEDWMEKLHEPFFDTEEDAETYVMRELPPNVPEGWSIIRYPRERLVWIIRKEKLAPGEWHGQEYCVRISKGLDVVLLTYGNNDCGPLRLKHALHTALVIEAPTLRKFPLGECLRSLFADRKPNEWGYT